MRAWYEVMDKGTFKKCMQKRGTCQDEQQERAPKQARKVFTSDCPDLLAIHEEVDRKTAEAAYLFEPDEVVYEGAAGKGALWRAHMSMALDETDRAACISHSGIGHPSARPIGLTRVGKHTNWQDHRRMSRRPL